MYTRRKQQLDSCCCGRCAPQDLRDRTYYLSNGVIRVGGRRVATNAANFQKGDTVGCVLDADQVGAGGDETARWGQQDRRSRIPSSWLGFILLLCIILCCVVLLSALCAPVLAPQGEIIFFRNGVEQGRARGIRGRLYPFVSCDSEGDQVRGMPGKPASMQLANSMEHCQRWPQMPR